MRAVLEFLALNRPAAVPRIARSRHVTRQHIQTLVNALLELDLVALEANPEHRRSALVRLTPEAQKVIERMKRREQRFFDQIHLGTKSIELKQAAETLRIVRSTLVVQFGRPSGFLGRVAGLIMRVRQSNHERNLRTVALLDIRPEDEVLEVGFGPGLAIERAAKLASRGKVVGIDHSELMLRQARGRNANAIDSGRVELLLGSVNRLPDSAARFDKVFAVNVYIFWDDPVTVLRGLRNIMKPGGMVALTLQPRDRGATNDEAREAAERMASSLRGADFENVRIEIFEMAPVNAACVLG